MKILISAYACSPYQGSEASVGWGFILELSKSHNLTIFVEEEKFRQDIENFLSQNESIKKNLNFIFVRKKRNRRLRKIWPPSYYRYLKEWHREVFKLARKIHKLEHFDLIHQLTMVGFREPGYLWKLNAPYVWGPVGGMGYFPLSFIFKIGFKGFIYYLAYNFFNFIHMKFLIRPRLAAKKAGKALITANTENQIYFESHFNCHSSIIAEVGTPNLNQFTSSNLDSASEKIKLVWSGQHLPRKALNIALRAVSLLPKRLNWELHILGEGVLTKKWINYAKSLRIEKRCKFHGMVSRHEALNIMSNTNISLITSLRDLNSSVTIESISLGLPVICIDHCGFSDVIDETCGVKVPLTNFNKVSEDISNAILDLADNREYLDELSFGAIEKSKLYSWQNKVRILNEIYLAKLKEYKKNPERNGR